MKTAFHLVALAALLIPSLLFASTIDVTFDAALTNATGWVYSEKMQRSSTGGEHFYFNTIGSFVKSPVFPFRVTSVRLELSCSSTTPTRHLAIVPSAGESLQSADVSTKDKKEFQTFAFDGSDAARSFEIVLTGSGQTGNWHLYSAEIAGVPLIAPPDGLAAPVVKRDGFTLRWDNPDGAVSNRVEIFEVQPGKDDKGDSVEYDFSDFRNDTGNARDATDVFTNSIPAFAGSSLIRLPANSSGTIQISKDDTKGYLVHSGFADFSGMSLAVSARIPTDSQGKVFGIGYIAADGATNEVASLPLSLDFTTNTVSLADVPPRSPIIFNTQGANSKRIVHVDYLAFTDTSACVPPSTNLVASFFATAPTVDRKGLRPGADYLVRVSAFDAGGNESDFSDPLAVRTLSTIPTKITLR